MHTNHEFMFRNLTSGDKILVVHGPTLTSYPGSTGIYFCIKLTDGDITDVPSKILLELYDMGWIGENEDNFPYKFRRANYQASSASMTVIMPDTWEYEYVSANSIGEPYGIAFWPKAASEGRIELLCYPYGYDNTNSPELKTRGIELNGFEATMFLSDPSEAWTMGDYSKAEIWSYIHFMEPYSSYVFHNTFLI